jgi:hypothetical protein
MKPLEELSYCVGQFCHGESSLGGSAIAGASAPIKKAIEDYSVIIYFISYPSLINAEFPRASKQDWMDKLKNI